MPAGDLPLVERRAARAILLDEHGDVLLLQGRDPGVPDAPRWWFTPGGGLGPNEDPIAGLRRECWEELGFIPDSVHGPIAHERTAFEFNRHWLVQESDFFWARVDRFTPKSQRLTRLEQDFILGWRWWSPASLATTRQTIYPSGLAGLIARI